MIALRGLGVAGALLLALPAPAARGQDTAAVPRPHLALGVDSNSAQANYNRGLETFRSAPDESVRAFYWASRLDPSSGDALIALRAAKLMAMPMKEVASYATQPPGKRTAAQLALDSLIYRAYTIDPFVLGNFDLALAERMTEAQILAANPKIEPWALDMAAASRMRLGGNWAWVLYTQGKYEEALAAYARELQFQPPPIKDKKHAEVAERYRAVRMIAAHVERARIFFVLDSLDSARAEMTTAIDSMRALENSKNIVMLYQSKAMFLHSLGMIEERAHRDEQARTAFSAALQEDLSFYSAHSHLAQLALAQNDTTSALAEMDLAVQLQPNDPSLRYRYADVLLHAWRNDDAAAQLRKAIALDPWYGAPHLLLARIADLEHHTDVAMYEYRQYISVASKTDTQLLIAKERLSKLTSTVASSQAKQ